MITKGIARYIYLDSTEKFRGRDTGKYSLTIELPDTEALKLENLGVKVNEIYDKSGRMYKSRKFSTRYSMLNHMIKTKSGQSIGADFGDGTEVEVFWKAGIEGFYGVPTYLVAIKVEDDYKPGYKLRNDELVDFFNVPGQQSKQCSSLVNQKISPIFGQLLG